MKEKKKKKKKKKGHVATCASVDAGQRTATGLESATRAVTGVAFVLSSVAIAVRGKRKKRGKIRFLSPVRPFGGNGRARTRCPSRLSD